MTARNGIIHRCHSVAGGGWGGQAVNEEFKQLLIKIVGAPVFLKFAEVESEDGTYTWNELEKDFEAKKRVIGVHNTGKITLSLPALLCDLYSEMFHEKIQDAIEASPYAENIHVIGGKIRIDASVFKGLYRNAVSSIISNIKDTLEKVKGTKIIIMVGGFSDSPLVKNAVKKTFPDCNIFVPTNPAFTLIQGAILAGHHKEPPKAKACAVSDFTYGVQVCHINDENGCSEVEREEFKIFIRKGETVYEGEYVTWELTIEACDMQHVEIQFVAFPRNEAISLEEKDVEYLETYRIDFEGVYTKDIRIHMGFCNYSKIITKSVCVSGSPIPCM